MLSFAFVSLKAIMDKNQQTNFEEGSGFSKNEILQYFVVLIIYILLGFTFRTIFLNWIVGPMFLITTLYLIPKLFSAIIKKVKS